MLSSVSKLWLETLGSHPALTSWTGSPSTCPLVAGVLREVSPSGSLLALLRALLLLTGTLVDIFSMFWCLSSLLGFTSSSSGEGFLAAFNLLDLHNFPLETQVRGRQEQSFRFAEAFSTAKLKSPLDLWPVEQAGFWIFNFSELKDNCTTPPLELDRDDEDGRPQPLPQEPCCQRLPDGPLLRKSSEV